MCIVQHSDEDSLIPGQRLIEQVCKCRGKVLVADGAHAAERTSAGLWCGYASQSAMKAIYQIWNLSGRKLLYTKTDVSSMLERHA